jgi:hypothetical protein
MGLKREVVRGRPIRWGAREIVPEAVIWSWQRTDATLRQAGSATLLGGLFRWVRPTALLDRTPERTERVLVRDVNHRLEGAVLIAALLLPIVMAAAANLLRGALNARGAKEKDHV